MTKTNIYTSHSIITTQENDSKVMQEDTPKFNSLILAWIKDFSIWIFLIALLSLERIALLGLFCSQLNVHTPTHDFLLFFYKGLQSDSRVATLLIAPSFLLAFVNIVLKKATALDEWRLKLGKLWVFATILIWIIDLAFFFEYHDQFNSWLFIGLHDDWNAILATAWNSYPILKGMLGIIILTLLSNCLLKYWINLFARLSSLLSVRSFSLVSKILICCCTSIVLFIGFRGSAGRRPLQRKDIAVTQSDFLNKLIPNPYFALYYAYKDYRILNSSRGLDAFLKNDEDLYTALDTLFPGKKPAQLQSLDSYFLQTVESSSKVKPKHVFIIVMESQDSWPLLQKYEALGINPYLNDLKRKGIWVKSFVSSGSGTILSLNSLITGLPEVGVFTNYQPSSSLSYPSSIATQFKQLGYTTNFFYGGYLSWQRIGQFASDQGFENVYGGSHMGPWEGNEWGVDDRHIFEFMLKTIDPEKPSFNLVMTTSNHPSYTVNLAHEGCPILSIPDSLKELYDKSVDLHILGHTWYADRCVGKFIEEAEKKLAPSLFAITGDHWSRHFLHSKPSLYERKSVPLILYGPQVLENKTIPKNLAGSHTDIAPTLINLCAPQGFTFCSFGRNILDLSQSQVGYGVDVIVMPSCIFHYASEKSIEPIPESENFECLPETLASHSQNYRFLHALSWWRIMKGNSLPLRKKPWSP